MENIQIWLACNLTSKDKYLDSVRRIIIDSIEKNHPIFLYDDEEILNRYENSVVAINEWNIIANASIYPTQIVPLDSIFFDWHQVKIWECGSLMVDSNNRQKWLWGMMSDKAINELWKKYDALILATLNPVLVRWITEFFWFEQVVFPQEYYEESLEYMAPKLSWWLEEFEKNAKFFVKFNEKRYREQILFVLENQ